MPTGDVLLSFETNVFSWEGAMALMLKVRQTRRHRLQKLVKVIDSIIKDDAKPAAKSARAAKIKFVDDTVVFTTTTRLSDFVNNIRARAVDLLAR